MEALVGDELLSSRDPHPPLVSAVVAILESPSSSQLLLIRRGDDPTIYARERDTTFYNAPKKVMPDTLRRVLWRLWPLFPAARRQPVVMFPGI